jgi:hypothetical protein
MAPEINLNDNPEEPGEKALRYFSAFCLILLVIVFGGIIILVGYSIAYGLWSIGLLRSLVVALIVGSFIRLIVVVANHPKLKEWI